MSSVQERCAALAAAMLDSELRAILRKLVAHQPLSNLQATVVKEAEKRALVL